ncbi:hypothetical protein I3F58_02475 [Streptomyces sp. MUM 203J]|uniref:hypothetical protein n=1 Tax=Streptomyces sp. MUM 203J TaxID=2791990 RepID=UPI001F04B60E|nr:hypothetical protein [Streptomyces sp. MUM 203J]MCH0538444.1 hypothetical protein [Streptomyces sp. MUM 203J]
MGIIHAFLRTLLGVLVPGSGRRRAGGCPAATARAPRAAAARSAGASFRPEPGTWFGPSWGWTARPRSPYGGAETFAGEDTVLVRPYLLEHERQEERDRQRQRCLALVLAADFGVDLDTRVLHGAGAAW